MTIGFWQVVLVLLIVLIIFGAGKLPRVMGDVAKGIKSFKAGMQDDEGPAKEEPRRPIASEEQVDREGQAVMKQDETARS
jgi:sec-independent protein translocase protein TatA